MKKLSLVLTFISLFVGISMAETAPDFKGPVTRSELESKGFPWLADGLKANAGKTEEKPLTDLKSLGQGLSKTEIEVYFGSWCGDTHDQLPVFLTMLDGISKKSGMNPKSLKLFGLDRKKHFDGFKNERKIERLPTFIYLRDGKEIGRIIETPKVGIYEDTRAIVLK